MKACTTHSITCRIGDYKIKAYSFSSFKDFETCAKQFFLVRVSKQVSRKYDAAGPGRAFHKCMDQAVKFDEDRLPSAFTEHEWVLKRVNKIKQQMARDVVSGITSVASEVGISVSNQWEAGPMFHKDAWYCGQLDFLMTRGHLAYLSDWKFGNSGYADVDQLYQQACLIFHAMPEITRIRADLTFVKDKVMVPAVPLTINRDTLQGLRDDISQKAGRIYKTSLAANDKLAAGLITELHQGWEASPNGLCNKYCPVPKSMCEHSGLED